MKRSRKHVLSSPARLLFALVAFAAGLVAAASASADPIFNVTGAAPEVISPNGDLVQDVITVTYTIAVDSAQVAVVVTPPDGGSTLATVQPLTRQGRGLHSVAFDGKVDGVALPDGAYRVVIFGVGSEGEGEETVPLPFTVDTVAPVILSLDPVEPGDAVVRNGDLIILDACIEGNPTTVTASFAELDTGWDPARVTITPLDAVCRRISYTLSPANNRTDAANLAVSVVAVDAGGNRTTAVARYCLSNDPPVVIESHLVSEFPDFQNGDRVVAEIAFSSPALVLSVTGDFSELDSEFQESMVSVRNLGGQRYEVSYAIDEFNTRPDGAYRIRLVGRDPGCGEAIDSTLVVNLDNAGNVAAVIGDVALDHAAFSPNGDGAQDAVGIDFTALEDTVFVSIVAEVRTPPNNLLQSVIVLPDAPYLAGPHVYTWNGSFTGSGIDIATLADQTIKLTIRGRSTDSDRRRSFVFDLVLDRQKPVFKSFTEPAAGVKNGQRVDLAVSYDQSGLALTPDFSTLDTGFTSQSPVAVSDNKDGSYTISYVITTTNARDDGSGIFIPITAVDPAGNRSTTSLVQICLNNHPPALVSVEITGDDQPPFGIGSEIELLTTWSGSLPPFTLGADFKALDSNYSTGKETVQRIGDGRSFKILYRISSTNAVSAEADLPIVFTVTNGGCGRLVTSEYRVALDTVKPSARPVIDAPPGVVRVPTVTLTGEAQEADSVEIRNFQETVAMLPVTGDRFSGEVPLAPGQNRLSAVGIDAAGNRSTVSASVEVFFVSEGFFTVPGRFTPGDNFFVGLLDPVDEVAVHVFNLEGVQLRRLTAGPGDLFNIPWDGRDSTGEIVASGPYIAVLEIFETGGGVSVKRKAFVFSRRGVETP